MIDDPQSEVNLLNEQGITTVFSSYGSGSASVGQPYGGMANGHPYAQL